MTTENEEMKEKLASVLAVINPLLETLTDLERTWVIEHIRSSSEKKWKID